MTTSRTSAIAERLNAARDAKNWDLVIRLCRQALRKNGNHQQAHRLLGFALWQRSDTTEALTAYRHASIFWPQDAELLINYANLLISLMRNTEALPLMEKVVQLYPDNSICWTKMAQCCYQINLHPKGFEAAKKALACAKNIDEQVDALTQLAIHRRELGQVHEAVENCLQAIALRPHIFHNYTNSLLFMLADPACKPSDIYKLARDFNAEFCTPLKENWPDFSKIDHHPWRRLRIGFISPDFRDHAVMYFVEGLLAQLDRRMFEVVAFHLCPTSDHITTRIKRHADKFIDLSRQTPQTQAQAITAEKIDIAIDLAGHTGNSGLQALLYKPAPIQVSWLGYPATTGCDAIDYKFSDEITDAPGADDQYSERLYRLPTLFCCYRPMIRGPLLRYQPRYLVRPTPALNNGYITFGSCNNLGKLTDNVLTLWGQILMAVPQSKLLIEGKNFDVENTAAEFRQRCSNLGIPPDRLQLIAQDPRNQYLTYHKIDIALDPFPLVGGTTTFDVLWMGVPLVSMQGDSFKSRMGVGILSYLMHTDWLAKNEEEYLYIAKTLAADVNHLNQVRLSLREEVEQSPLMHETTYTQLYGEGLRVMWLQWLAQQQYPDNEAAQQQAMGQWVEEFPAEWNHSPEPGVGLEPGKRVPLTEAHALLQTLVDRAKALNTPHGNTIEDRRWIHITELAETVLCAVPHDPVALACLAEVEHAHGHTDFAVTYLRYATEAMARQ